MNKTTSSVIKRSMFTTIAAAIIGLAILAVSLLILPITNVAEGVTFGIGLLLVILCGITAYEGRKKTIREIIDSMLHWR